MTDQPPKQCEDHLCEACFHSMTRHQLEKSPPKDRKPRVICMECLYGPR